MNIDVVVTGPLFHNRTALFDELERGLTAALSKATEEAVHINLAGSLQHPTGYYQSHIKVIHHGPAYDEVTDQGIIYGPWLEGVGSRNRTTRFKGYSSFRRAAQTINAKAVELCEPVVEQIVRRFNR